MNRPPIDKVNKNVMDIMYQILYDEKRYGLKSKEQPSDTDLLQTRTQLLEQISKELKEATEMQTAPDFRLREMSDLLEGKDLPKEAIERLMTPDDQRQHPIAVVTDLGDGLEIKEDAAEDEEDEMLKLQARVIEKRKGEYTRDDDVVCPTIHRSLKARGVTDTLEMAKMMPKNKYFQEFARQHVEGVEKVIDKAYGSSSHYGRTMHKANVSSEPPLRPFKQRFYQSVNQNSVFRAQNKKAFSGQKKAMHQNLTMNNI